MRKKIVSLVLVALAIISTGVVASADGGGSIPDCVKVPCDWQW